jgi:exosortase/archaeosortase family protein
VARLLCFHFNPLGDLLEGGSRWLRHFSFPFFFLLLSVPWPTVPEQALIQSMMRAVTGVTVEALNWCGYFALQRGNLILLPSGVVGVDEACSGVRSLQSTLMAALFIGELSRLPWFKRLILLLSGLVIAFILNCLWAFSLSLFHIQGGNESLAQWHDPAGYAILLISFALLLLVARILTKAATPINAGQQDNSFSASLPTNHLRPRLFSPLALLVLALWLIFCEAGTELWYRSHERSWEKKTDWSLGWSAESETFKKREIPERVHTILRYNRGPHGILQRPDGNTWSIFELVWFPGRVSAQLAKSHSPEICMPAGGINLVKQDKTEFWKIGLLNLPVQCYTFQSSDQRRQVYYIVWEDRSEQAPLQRPQDFYQYSERLRVVKQG